MRKNRLRMRIACESCDLSEHRLWCDVTCDGLFDRMRRVIFRMRKLEFRMRKVIFRTSTKIVHMRNGRMRVACESHLKANISPKRQIDRMRKVHMRIACELHLIVNISPKKRIVRMRNVRMRIACKSHLKSYISHSNAKFRMRKKIQQNLLSQNFACELDVTHSKLLVKLI